MVLARRLPLDRNILMISGRASFEIMQKALTARILAFMSSVLAISIMRAFSLAMMSLGVPAGAKMENQIGTSAPPMPSSLSVGTSGKSGWRAEPLMLSRISLPALTCGSDTGSFIM